MLNNRIPPGRASQNNAYPPGRGGQQQQRQITQPQIPLTIAGFSRKSSGNTNGKLSNVIVDLTVQTPTLEIVQPNFSTGERRVVKLTAEQEYQQRRQWREQQRVIQSAKLKEKEAENTRKLERDKRKQVVLKPHPFTVEETLFYEARNRNRNAMVDAVALTIIHRIFGHATVKVNGQLLPYVPAPVDLSLEPELLNVSNPNSYNFWITHVSSGLIKRLSGLVVRGLYPEEIGSNFMMVELNKLAINLAIMVREDRSLWGYVSLLPTQDGVRFVLTYNLPVPLDWNDDNDPMKYQIAALNDAYQKLMSAMMED